MIFSKIKLEMLVHYLTQMGYKDKNEIELLSPEMVGFVNDNQFYLKWNNNLMMWQLEESKSKRI